MSNTTCERCNGTAWTEDFYPCDCGASAIVPERGQRKGMIEDAPVRRAGGAPARGAARPVKLATEKQVAYLRSLIAGRDAAHPAVVAAAAVCGDDMSMRDASTHIDALRAIAPAPKAGAVRTNNYPGKCTICGQHVAEQAGRIAPRASGKGWDTMHLAGECPAAAATVPAEAPVCPADGLDLAPLAKFGTKQSNGATVVRFGVPNGDTRLKLRLAFTVEGTVWVTDAAEYGQRSTYGAQRPGQAYRGKVADALRAILADPTAAAIRYAELTSTCSSCGRKLELETSVAQGMGAVCAGKFDM